MCASVGQNLCSGEWGVDLRSVTKVLSVPEAGSRAEEERTASIPSPFSITETTATPTAVVATTKMRIKSLGNYTSTIFGFPFLCLAFPFFANVCTVQKTTTLHGLTPSIFSCLLSRSISPAIIDRVALASFLSLFVLPFLTPLPPYQVIFRCPS